MKITRFDLASALIIVAGRVWGPHNRRFELRLVVDTGSSETIIAPEVLDRIGYSPRQGEAITVIRSAVGREPGYLIRVTRLSCLGFDFSDFRVHAHDLPEGFGIQGLVGLSFLRQFNYEIRSSEGRILVERIGASELDQRRRNRRLSRRLLNCSRLNPWIGFRRPEFSYVVELNGIEPSAS